MTQKLKGGWVYILTNKPRGVIYVGVTSNLRGRMFQHRNTEEDSFVKKYRLNRLVLLEEYPTIEEAIIREKQLKNWRREWKINLIEQVNWEWRDFLRDSTDQAEETSSE